MMMMMRAERNWTMRVFISAPIQQSHSVILWSHFPLSTEHIIKNVLKSLEKIEKQNCNCYETAGVTTELYNTELFASHMKIFRYRNLSISTVNTLTAVQCFISRVHEFRNWKNLKKIKIFTFHRNAITISALAAVSYYWILTAEKYRRL